MFENNRVMLKRYFGFLVTVFCVLCSFNVALAEDDPQVGTQAKGTYFRAVVLDSLTREPIEFATLHAKYKIGRAHV